MDTQITYFPVGNGDTSLIRLADKTSILIDCNLRQCSQDEEDDTQYDVCAHLLEELERDENKRPFVDAFILTHPDQDHCRGFEASFHLGDVANYKKEKDQPEKIIIAELWFSQRIFSNFERAYGLNNEAKAFRKEALRRIKLHRNGDARRDEAGNRIRIIGYGEAEETKGLGEITTIPGNEVNCINGQTKNDFSFFVHAPFKDCIEGEDRNNTSIVLQARFAVSGKERAGLALFGGDAKWDIWAKILERSEDETLEWDLLLSPHHCSWTFFNEVPYAENKTPKQTSLDLLEKCRMGASVIASSKPILDNDDNPPHFHAKAEYVEVVANQKFYCCGEHPSEDKPEPIVFRITRTGAQKADSGTAARVGAATAVHTSLQTPRIYG